MGAGPLVKQIALAVVGAIALSGCATATDVFPSRPGVNVSNWKSVATENDRDRLRDWRKAFVEGLDQANQTNAADVASMGALLTPDLANEYPLPPVGAYQCRIIKLGNSSLDPRPLYIVYPWYPCSVADKGNGTWRFTMQAGPQRPIGNIYPKEAIEGVFLGTLQLSDETHKIAYSRDTARDMAGFVERVDEARWRIILPRPHFELVMDVIEVVPSSTP